MISAYEGNGLNDALGLFMIVWLIFTLLIFPPTFKTSVGLVSLCEFLSCGPPLYFDQ